MISNGKWKGGIRDPVKQKGKKREQRKKEIVYKPKNKPAKERQRTGKP